MHDDPPGDSAIFALGHLRRLQVDGARAVDWLDRLLSCKVATLATGEARLGCWCNIKGRVIAVVLAVRRAGGVDLFLDASLAAQVAGQLRRYILREALSIAEDPVPPAGIRRAGDGTAAVGDGPAQAAALPWDRRRAIVPGPAATDEAALLAWRLADLDAGVVWLSTPVSGLFLPQMLGLEAAGAVDYGKGCYPGQEIIARAHHLGRVKKSAFRFTMQSNEAPPAGAVILDAGGAPSGTVIESCRGGDDSSRGIAVLDHPADRRWWLCEFAGRRLPLTAA